MYDRERLATIARLYEPAAGSAIEAAQAKVGFPFPAEYRALLQITNGMDGTTSEDVHGTSFHKCEETAEHSTAYEFQQLLPGYLLIAVDGGSRGFYLDRDGSVYGYDGGTFASEVSDLRRLAGSLTEWFDARLDPQDPPKAPDPPRVDVYLVAAPLTGIKGVHMVCKTLHLKMPMSEYRKVLDKLPYRLLHGVFYCDWTYRSVEDVPELERCLAIYETDNPSQRRPLLLHADRAGDRDAMFADYDRMREAAGLRIEPPDPID